MLLVFQIAFSVPVISRIESIGGGGGEGGWEAKGGLKQPFGLKQHCCAFCLGPELVQSTEWAKTAVRSSLVSHAVLLMPLRAEKCILVVQQHWQKVSVKADLAIYGQVLGVSE